MGTGSSREGFCHRANRIIPEPFFVHGDLTTGVQIADLVAGVISWGFRVPRMVMPARAELWHLADQVARLRYRATAELPRTALPLHRPPGRLERTPLGH